MLFGALQFLSQLFCVVFLLYKSLNLLRMMQSKDQSKEQLFLVVTSWIVFLSMSSLKCSCSGFFGLIWNTAVQAALIHGLLSTAKVQKKLFEENTLETGFSFVKGMVEKYMPKQKTQ